MLATLSQIGRIFKKNTPVKNHPTLGQVKKLWSIIFGAKEGYTVAEDWPQGDAETREYLDQAAEPLYHIVDVTEVSLALDDIVLGSNRMARGHEPLWQHPNLLELIFISANTLFRLAAKGLDSLTFGNLKTMIFETQEEALAYCRAKIAEG